MTNPDKLLKFLYKCIKNDLIYEKTKVLNFSNGLEIKNIETKKINIRKSIIEINLDQNKKLLVCDRNLNLLLSHTIILGDETKLCEFNIENRKEKFIADEYTLSILKKEKIQMKIIKEVKPTFLFKQEIKYNFEEIDIIKKLKQYSKEALKINLNSIHIVKGNKLKPFVPTLKNSDLTLATSMKIPVVRLISKNYIRDTNINIFDDILQEKKLNSFLSFNEKKEVDFEKEKSQIYKDIDTNYYLKINISDINEKISKIPKSNVDKNRLISKIKKHSKFRLSYNQGKTLLPLWKIKEEQKFIEINGIKDFLNISGRPFEFNLDLFKTIYIINERGFEGSYKEKYLSKRFEKLFENINESKILEFEDEIELIIKIIYMNDIEALMIKEKIKKTEISSYSNQLIKLKKKIIDISINYNYDIKKEKTKSEFSNILNEYSEKLKRDIGKYLEKPKKKQFLISNLQEIQRFNKYLNNKKIEKGDLYFILKILKIHLIILSSFNEEKSLKISQEIESIFKNLNLELNTTNSKKLGTAFSDLIKNKDKKKLYYINKRENSYFKQELKEFIKLENYEIKKYIKPKINLLKKNFPYSYEEISKKIVKYDSKDLEEFEIKIKERFIKIKKNFYSEINIYQGFKKLCENEYFILLEKISNN